MSDEIFLSSKVKSKIIEKSSQVFTLKKAGIRPIPYLGHICTTPGLTEREKIT
jgi:hypothetical protein